LGRLANRSGEGLRENNNSELEAKVGGAGLVTHATSDGIRVTPPLDAAVLDLTLVTPSETMYPRTADARVQVRAHAGRGRHSARKPTVSRRVSPATASVIRAY